MNADSGYRDHHPNTGPRLRTDVVDVYIFQRSTRPPDKLHRATDSGDPSSPSRPQTYFLQLLRSGPPLADTWHPVMGHIEAGETAVQAMWRELREELGLGSPSQREGAGGRVLPLPLPSPSPPLLSIHALEQTHPFFIAELDAIVLSPRFAAEVTPGWTPTLNDEHRDWRWVHAGEAPATFMWPGQIAACREIVERLLPEGSLMRERVRIGGTDEPRA